MNDLDNYSTKPEWPGLYPKRKGLGMMFPVAGLLLAASLLESLPYFRPVTIRAENHTVRIHKLPDNTAAVLDSASRLSLGKEWKGGEFREVWLQGGALFTIPAAGDTTGLTIHLPGFDVVAYNNASVYCFNRNKRMYAWLKEGRAAIVTHDAKPKKWPLLPGNLVEYSHLRFLTKKNGQPVSSPAD